MTSNTVGKIYRTGEIVIREGDRGDQMYVIQEGEVEVLLSEGARVVQVAEMGEGDFFGEMEIFERKPRSATVRVLRRSRILTVDKNTLLRRIQQDPSLALHLLETLSHRLRERNARTSAELKQSVKVEP